jgi:hypothetical protein
LPEVPTIIRTEPDATEPTRKELSGIYLVLLLRCCP